MLGNNSYRVDKGHKTKAADPDYEEVNPLIARNMHLGGSKQYHCDLCGSLEGAVKCTKCNDQIFCFACDDVYHRHPKRFSHVRKAVESHNANDVPLVRPPIPVKLDNQTPAPLPPPRKNKRIGSNMSEGGGTKRRSSLGGIHLGLSNDGGKNIINSLKKFVGGTRPLPNPPDKSKGSIYKAGSTGNLALNHSNQQSFQNQSMQVAIPKPMMDSNVDNRGSLPPSGINARAQPKPVSGHSRKLSLQQFPPKASMVDTPQQNGNWDTPPQIPQKMRSQSISDDQWNKTVMMQGHNHPHGYHGNTALSEVGMPTSIAGYNTLGPNGRPRYPGMSSSTSVTDLNIVPRGYHGMQPANSFQQLAMMGYDPNMMWMPCPMCPPQPMYPHAMPGMKRAASNVSMNMSSAASDASGYQWSAPGHMHQHHHMPMYPGYYPGGHHHMMHHMAGRGSSGSIPDSMNSYNQKSSNIAHRPSSRRSQRSSKSRSHNVPDTNGTRSRGHSRPASVDSNDSRVSSGSDEIHQIDLKTKKPGSLSWQCHHCTFMNPGHTNTCGMCSKTIPEQEINIKDTRYPKTQIRRKNSNQSSFTGNLSDYDNNRMSPVKANKEPLSRKLSSSRRHGSKVRNKSSHRYNSGSDSASVIGSEISDRDCIDRQFENLRIGTNKMSGVDNSSVTSSRNSGFPKKEEGRKPYRKRSRSHSLRPKTPVRNSPENVPFSSSDEFNRSDSESSEGKHPRIKTSQDTSVVLRKNSNRHAEVKRFSGLSRTSSDKYNLDDDRSNQDLLPIDYQEDKHSELSFPDTQELLDDEKDIIKDILSNTQHLDVDSFTGDDEVFEPLNVGKVSSQTEKSQVKRQQSRGNVPSRPISSHYEQIDQPLEQPDISTKPPLSEPTRQNRDESYYTASELDQVYEDELKTRKLSQGTKIEFKRGPSTMKRQQSPLSISSSEAIFYSPPDTPDMNKISYTSQSDDDDLVSAKEFLDDNGNSLHSSREALESSSDLLPLDNESNAKDDTAIKETSAPPYRPLMKSASDKGIFSNEPYTPFQKNTDKSIQKRRWLTDEEKSMTIDELVAKRRQETMREQGLEVVQLLREAEEVGYNPDEVSIAMSLSGGKNPLEWLKENWKHMVDTVMTLATNYSKQQPTVNPMAISDGEAKEALRIHKGNIWAAVSECVEQKHGIPTEESSQSVAPSQSLNNEKDSEGNLGKVQRIGSFLKRMWTAPQQATSSKDQPTNEQKVIESSDKVDPKDQLDSKSKYLGESFFESKAISKELKSKILVAMTSQTTPANQELDSDVESTIEELLGVSENPSFYDYFTAVDLDKYSEDELESITEEEEIEMENDETESDVNSASPVAVYDEFLSMVDALSGKEDSPGSIHNSTASSSQSITSGTQPADQKETLETKSSPAQNVADNTKPQGKPQTGIKILPRFVPKVNQKDVSKISRWKSIEFKDESNLEPELPKPKWQEERTLMANSVIRGSLEVKQNISTPAIEIELEEEEKSVSVTTGKLNLPLIPFSGNVPTTSPKTESQKTENLSPRNSRNLEHISSESSVEEEERVPTETPKDPPPSDTVAGIRMVKKATTLVGLAISKAMARESTVKDTHKRDSMSSNDSLPHPLSPISDDTKKSEIEGSLTHSPDLTSELNRSQSPIKESVSEVNSKSSSTVENLQKKIVVPPAVVSYSGPIFIPSKSGAQDLKTNNNITTKKAEISPKSPNALQNNTILNPPGPTSSLAQLPKPHTPDNINRNLLPPQHIETLKSGSPEKDTSLLSSRNNNTNSRDGGSTMVSPSDSEEEPELQNVENITEEVTDKDLEEVKKLEEQINLMRQEIQARISPTSDNFQQSDEEGPSDVLEDNPEKTGASKPMTAEEKQEYEQLQFDRTVRRLLAEGQAETYEKAELAAQLVSMTFDEEDSIQAAAECSSIYSAMKYLRQECELCAEPYPMGKMVSMLHCTHRCCNDCAANYFTFQIKAKNIRELTCPFCSQPELNTASEELAMEYFNHLDILLKNIIDSETHELFQRKVRDITLMKDPNFRWCNRCSSGFIASTRARKLFCPDCQEVTCAQCRQVWEPQHEGISCEEFKRWQEANNPESQALGVAQHLAECGITCPECKFTYALAKGGCMHFICTECKYEFCSGCSKPFKQGAKCNVGPYCEKLGLHAHHPRNCLFYLRDRDPEYLQALLKEHEVPFDTEPAYDSEKTGTLCRVMEQKELADGELHDDYCGRTVLDGHAGLCNIHYTEYLVEKINVNNLDPVTIFDEADLRVCLRRNGKTVPIRRWESEKIYRDKLIKLIKDQLPLT